MTKLLIVDGNSLANRAFYALPFLTNSKVQPSGAVYGFVNLITKIITDYRPDGIAVAFDHARKTFRNDIFEGYKANRRPTPPELISQFPVIKELLRIMNITVIEQEGIEADDIIGTISKKSNCQKIILSGDRDLLQLIDENTEVWLTLKGVTDVLKVGVENLKEVYGVDKPEQVIDLKALMGDKSDNIPGVKGIGDKTAAKMLSDFGDLDGLYAHLDELKPRHKELLEQEKTMAYLSKELATIRTNCDIDFNLNESGYDFPYNQKTFDFFDEWNFNSLTKRKDLFQEDLQFESEINDVEKIKIASLEVVDELIKEIKSEFAYSIEKMEFSASKEKLYYIEPEISMFNDTVALEDVLEKLRDVFEDSNILKITDSAKADLHVFDKYGIELKNYYDITVAGYILYTGVTSDKLSKIKTNLYFSKRKQLDKNMDDMGLLDLYKNFELPLINVLFEMEKFGFKLDREELDKIDIEFTTELENVTKEIYELADEVFNINAPKAVAHILFEKLELKAYNNKKMSTSIEILRDIAWQHPIVDKIIKYRKFQKFKASYVDVYKKLCENQGDIIHTSFNQTLTNTGRLSSSEPNLQNIPTRDEDGKILRKIFVSTFEDGQLISADYNQIELRLLADMSGEQSLVDIYKNNGDIHALTASQIFNIPMAFVDSKQRRDAKAVNFGVIYGISQYGLSQNLGITSEQAKNYISSYFERYPIVKKFNEDCVNFAREKGFVKTKYGRIRHIPEINSSNYAMRSFAERVAMNMPLQGTASDIIKFAMIEVYNKIKEQKLRSKLILQIHDELIVDVYPGEIEVVKEILKETMENVVKLQVPLIVNIGVGKNLYECKD